MGRLDRVWPLSRPAPRAAPARSPRGPPGPRPARLDPRRRLLRGLRPLLLRQQRRRDRRPERAHRQARLHQRRQPGLADRSRRLLHLAHAGGGIAQLPRLRRQRLLPRRAGLRHQRRFQAAGRRGAPARHQGARGHGAQSLLERASVLPGGAPGHDLALPRLVPLLPDRRWERGPGARRRGTGLRCATSTTTAHSRARMPDLNYQTPPCGKRRRRSPRSGCATWAWTASGWTRCPTSWRTGPASRVAPAPTPSCASTPPTSTASRPRRTRWARYGTASERSSPTTPTSSPRTSPSSWPTRSSRRSPGAGRQGCSAVTCGFRTRCRRTAGRPFLSNHDGTRTMTALGGDPAAAKLAATLLLTLPGLPFVYYGEEIGMTGDKPDQRLRTPMQWAPGPGLGFTSGKPWEGAQPDSLTTTVERQACRPRLAAEPLPPADPPAPGERGTGERAGWCRSPPAAPRSPPTSAARTTTPCSWSRIWAARTSPVSRSAPGRARCHPAPTRRETCSAVRTAPSWR